MCPEARSPRIPPAFRYIHLQTRTTKSKKSALKSPSRNHLLTGLHETKKWSLVFKDAILGSADLITGLVLTLID